MVKRSREIKTPKSTKKLGFFPKKTLEGKSNYKPFFRIERDGKVIESVFLNVPDARVREEIIGIHFLRTYVRMIVQDDLGLNLLGRDEPWDFSYEDSNEEKFHIEIVSIAEDPQLFICRSSDLI